MRVFIITLGFTPPHILEKSFERLYESRNDALPIHKHVFLDQHWPVNKELTQAENKRISDQFGCHYMNPGRNLGLHEGWNWMCDRLDLEDGDILLAYDPDSWPLVPGWDMALLTVLMNDPTIVWSALYNEKVDGTEGVNWQEKQAGHLTVKVPLNRPCINSISAFRWDWLKIIGNFKEPNAFYGGLEAALWLDLKSTGKHMGYVLGFPDDMDHFWKEVHPLYREYKWEHAHKQTWKGDFESFLKSKGHSLIEAPPAKPVPATNETKKSDTPAMKPRKTKTLKPKKSTKPKKTKKYAK